MAQPFTNLSAGQRTMLALVADLAIKMVTQNNYLVPEDDPAPTNGALPDVLAQTPGVVLIDELDVHLHPRWQRRVASDLKSTFPRIQFVCTTHSPQVIGEVAPGRDPHARRAGHRPSSRSIVRAGLECDPGRHPWARIREIRPGAEAIEAVEEALEEGDLDEARSDSTP